MSGSPTAAPEPYRLLVEGIHGCGLALLDAQGCVALCNASGKHILGQSGADILGRPLGGFFLEPFDERWLSRVARQESPQEERRCRHGDGTQLWVRVIASTLAGGGRPQGFVVALRDVTTEKRADQRLLAHHAVTEILAEAPSLEGVTRRLLQAIGEQLEWQVGIFWGADAAAGRLRCLEVWQQPGVDADGLRRRSRELVLPRGEGLPGQVWAAGRPLWFRNVAEDAHFLRGGGADDEQMHGALAFPVLLGSEVLGVMEFFSREVRPPDEAILAMMATIGSQVGQFMKRKQVEHDLRESEERYRLIADNAAAGVFMIDERGTIRYANPAAEKIFGHSIAEMEGRNLTALMPEALRQRHQHGLERYLRTRERRIAWEGVEFPGLHKSGREPPLEMSFGEFTTREGQRRFVGMVHDLSERRQTQGQLRQALQELHALAAHLQSVREDERTRIAREIHDELGQALTGLKLDLAWIERRLREDRPQPAPAFAERLGLMSDLIDSTIQTVRRIATELRPSVLDGLGLVAALRWLTEDFTSRSSCPCTFATTHEELPVEPRRATAVFRIAQEALTNVARHAQARSVALNLAVEADALTLEVRDDGKGLPDDGSAAGRRSLGLLGMKERALALGGEVSFTSTRGGGTLVRARIPVS